MVIKQLYLYHYLQMDIWQKHSLSAPEMFIKQNHSYREKNMVIKQNT